MFDVSFLLNLSLARSITNKGIKAVSLILGSDGEEGVDEPVLFTMDMLERGWRLFGLRRHSHE